MKLERLPKLEFRLRRADHGFCNVRHLFLNGHPSAVVISPECWLDYIGSIDNAGFLLVMFELELEVYDRIHDDIELQYILGEIDKYLRSPGAKF
jgi:hypothetical protein